MWFWPSASILEWVRFRLNNEEGTCPESEPIENAHRFVSTLIVLLSYAVYGATISPSYYIYETDATDTVFEDVEARRWSRITKPPGLKRCC